MVGLLANHRHWKTTTFVGALRHDRMTAPMAPDGPMNGAALQAYAGQILAPTLRDPATLSLRTTCRRTSPRPFAR
jgi:hypothetical protein